MSDIIFALKGRKANLAMKLQSCVKKATCGVDFFSTSQTALDIDRDICWGHFCRWLNHIKTLFTLKKCCDHKAFCKQKKKRLYIGSLRKWKKRNLPIKTYKLLTIKLLYSMFLTNYYIGAFVWK